LTPSTPSSTSQRRRALAHLRKADERLARIIDQVGACRFVARAEGTHFDALIRSIRYPTPEELLGTPEEKLRAAGLSRQKLGYLRDLARHVAADSLPIDRIHELEDEEVIEALTAVKGIGRWSAQMFLMFRLGRPDVLPDGDLGIRKGVQRAYRMRKLPPPKKVLAIGARWSPYASYACWYLWRSLDGDANLAD
jgi:DNA-3-methyladenine glycosylase II